MKHLLQFNHKLPMYEEGNLAKGEFYKKHTMPIDMDAYMSRREIKVS
jgi:hypothetical protein